MTKLSRRQLRKMILEQVAQDQAPEGESKEKVKPTSKVHVYLKNRAGKLPGGIHRTLGLVLAEEYMEGKISKDEAMETLMGIEKGARGSGSVLDMLKKLV